MCWKTSAGASSTKHGRLTPWDLARERLTIVWPTTFGATIGKKHFSHARDRSILNNHSMRSSFTLQCPMYFTIGRSNQRRTTIVKYIGHCNVKKLLPVCSACSAFLNEPSFENRIRLSNDARRCATMPGDARRCATMPRCSSECDDCDGLHPILVADHVIKHGPTILPPVKAFPW
jgi:hypothetical protein